MSYEQTADSVFSTKFSKLHNKLWATTISYEDKVPDYNLHNSLLFSLPNYICISDVLVSADIVQFICLNCFYIP